MSCTAKCTKWTSVDLQLSESVSMEICQVELTHAAGFSRRRVAFCRYKALLCCESVQLLLRGGTPGERQWGGRQPSATLSQQRKRRLSGSATTPDQLLAAYLLWFPCIS